MSFDDIDVAESLFIEISRPHGKNIIGGVIYRPPNKRVGDFVSKHNDLLEEISRENKICFIMGDLNLNLINFQHLSHGDVAPEYSVLTPKHCQIIFSQTNFLITRD